MKDIAPLIGFLGALPILALFAFLIRKKVNAAGIAILLVIVYTVSIATGVQAKHLKLVTNMQSAMIAGWVAPAIYCLILGLLVRFAPFLIMKAFRPGNQRPDAASLNILDLPPEDGDRQDGKG